MAASKPALTLLNPCSPVVSRLDRPGPRLRFLDLGVRDREAVHFDVPLKLVLVLKRLLELPKETPPLLLLNRGDARGSCAK